MLSFMGFSIGILALICVLILLFGLRGARKFVGWTFGLLTFGTIVAYGFIWLDWKTQQPAWMSAPVVQQQPQGLPPGFVLDQQPQK
jgi:hypothetical protein